MISVVRRRGKGFFFGGKGRGRSNRKCIEEGIGFMKKSGKAENGSGTRGEFGDNQVRRIF